MFRSENVGNLVFGIKFIFRSENMLKMCTYAWFDSSILDFMQIAVKEMSALFDSPYWKYYIT